MINQEHQKHKHQLSDSKTISPNSKSLTSDACTGGPHSAISWSTPEAELENRIGTWTQHRVHKYSHNIGFTAAENRRKQSGKHFIKTFTCFASLVVEEISCTCNK